jgi:ABC-type multidrug transport system fused ATPase/permease subunit
MADTDSMNSMSIGQILAKLWSLFDRDDRRKILGLLLLVLVGSFLEVMGVGLIVPVVALLSDPSIMNQEGPVKYLFELLGSPTQRAFMFWVLGLLLGAFVFKNVFLFASSWLQSQFIFSRQSEMCRALLSVYLNQPYTFHLQKNTAALVRNITSEVPVLFSSVFMQAIILLSEILVFAGVVTLIIWASPVAALVAMGGLGVVLMAYYRFFRFRLGRWGELVQEHSGGMIQQVQESLGGIKEVKIMGREQYFVQAFATHADNYAVNSRRYYLLSNTTRLIIETFVVAVLLGMVMALLARGVVMDSVVPALALYAAAAFRMMPSANRIMGAFNSIRFGAKSIQVIHHDFLTVETSESHHPKSIHSLKFNGVLELRDVAYQYPGAHELALKNVQLSIPRGSMVGFQGPSGAGKTTMVDLILGLIKPVRGEIFVDDSSIHENLADWQSQIGYVPQSIYLTDDTLRRNIAFGLADDQIDDEQVWEALRMAQLDVFVQSLPLGLETFVGERGVRISGGQRQRIGIARALYTSPDVLVFDEATASLDVETESEFIEVVKSYHGKKTVVIVSHRLSTLEHCDARYNLINGQLFDVGLSVVSNK